MDACRLGESISTIPFVSLVLKVLKQAIDFPFQCPMGPGNFSVKNIEVKSILPFLPDTKICGKITLLVKSKTSKNFINALVLKLNATYIL